MWVPLSSLEKIQDHALIRCLEDSVSYSEGILTGLWELLEGVHEDTGARRGHHIARSKILHVIEVLKVLGLTSKVVIDTLVQIREVPKVVLSEVTVNLLQIAIGDRVVHSRWYTL